MRRSFARALTDLAAHDPRIVLLTADLGFMVLEEFEVAHPSRFFNVGVAEANMVGLATGLAASGYIPYVYSIATFASMRPYEQIRNGPVLHNLPVRIVGTGGGFEYGPAGFTHHALEDLGIARLQPGLTVIAPADHLQAANAVRAAHQLPGPIYFRLGKRDDYLIDGLDGRFRLGKVEIIRKGPDLLVLSLGSITLEVVQAAGALAEKGVETTVAVVSCLAPPPVEELRTMLQRFPVAITVEEHYVRGALGSLVAEVLAEDAIPCKLVRCGVRAIPEVCGSESFLRDAVGLSVRGIMTCALEALGGCPA